MDAALAFALSLWPAPEPPRPASPWPTEKQCERQYNAARRQTENLCLVLNLYGFVDEHPGDEYLYGGGWHGKQTLKRYQRAKQVRDTWWSLWYLATPMNPAQVELWKYRVANEIGVDRYNARAWPWQE